MKKIKTILYYLLIVLIPINAMAQGCAVCTKVAADQNTNAALGLNKGIIYLAFIPAMIMGIIGYIWWKKNKNYEN